MSATIQYPAYRAQCGDPTGEGVPLEACGEELPKEEMP
jgi:hypothetical protein